MTEVAAAVYIGLVHHPIYNKKGEIVTTAVTNYDIHDICRTGRTYEVKRYFLIHPLESQVSLAIVHLVYREVRNCCRF